MSDSSIPVHLRLYTDEYFVGGTAAGKSGYDDYANCEGVLFEWAQMLEQAVAPTSVLDVGCAYGFVPLYFTDRQVRAYGVEPSEWARSRVHPRVAHAVLPGSLPDIPELITDLDRSAGRLSERFDLVTCTEVLEHVPEELVAASLEALAQRTERFLVCLVMLEGPGADGDEGHICLKSHDWWNWQFTKTGLVRNDALEAWFNEHPYSRSMHWSGRIFVRERVDG